MAERGDTQGKQALASAIRWPKAVLLMGGLSGALLLAGLALALA